MVETAPHAPSCRPLRSLTDIRKPCLSRATQGGPGLRTCESQEREALTRVGVKVSLSQL